MEAGDARITAASTHMGSAPVGGREAEIWGDLTLPGPPEGRTHPTYTAQLYPAQPNSLALATVSIACGVRERLHTRPGAVTLLATHQRVAAETLGLADHTSRWHGAWWADAATRELLTQLCPALTGYK